VREVPVGDEDVEARANSELYVISVDTGGRQE
jgi:hypothetical protein